MRSWGESRVKKNGLAINQWTASWINETRLFFSPERKNKHFRILSYFCLF